MSIELKIKIKSLAAEARIIRAEEHKQHRKPIQHRNFERENDLHKHRVVAVRRAARHAQLAYALIRGRAYKSVERTTRNPTHCIDVKEVQRMVDRYGRIMSPAKVDDWIKGYPLKKVA